MIIIKKYLKNDISREERQKITDKINYLIKSKIDYNSIILDYQKIINLSDNTPN